MYIARSAEMGRVVATRPEAVAERARGTRRGLGFSCWRRHGERLRLETVLIRMASLSDDSRVGDWLIWVWIQRAHFPFISFMNIFYFLPQTRLWSMLDCLTNIEWTLNVFILNPCTHVPAIIWLSRIAISIASVLPCPVPVRTTVSNSCPATGNLPLTETHQVDRVHRVTQEGMLVHRLRPSVVSERVRESMNSEVDMWFWGIKLRLHSGSCYGVKSSNLLWDLSLQRWVQRVKVLVQILGWIPEAYTDSEVVKEGPTIRCRAIDQTRREKYIETSIKGAIQKGNLKPLSDELACLLIGHQSRERQCATVPLILQIRPSFANCLVLAKY